MMIICKNVVLILYVSNVYFQNYRILIKKNLIITVIVLKYYVTFIRILSNECGRICKLYHVYVLKLTFFLKILSM